MKLISHLIAALLCGLSASTCAAQPHASASDATSSHSELLDASLSQWEIFMGVPHFSVTGLPEGTFQSDDVTKGTPLGLNNDPKKVYTTFTEDGTIVLYISGEIYGGLTTKKDYANYHLAMDFKWGDRKWEPRLKQKRDSGILYHCHGVHGAFWNVWKSCLESQVQETDMGDMHLLAGPKSKSKFRVVGEKQNIFDPHSPSPWGEWVGHLSASHEPDRPHGEWNHLEVYAVGDSTIHLANGIVVLAIIDALDKNGKPLTSGQIQIQSEAAECFYKNIRLTPIKAFPPDIAAKAGLTTDTAAAKKKL